VDHLPCRATPIGYHRNRRPKRHPFRRVSHLRKCSAQAFGNGSGALAPQPRLSVAGLPSSDAGLCGADDDNNRPTIARVRELLPTHGYGTVRPNTDEMAKPPGLVGTLAHEMAHQRLLGEGRLDPFVYDKELFADPLVVFKGRGIFLANLPRTWDGQFGWWSDSVLRKPEFMTSPLFGCVLGPIAWLRGKDRPAWHRHLNLRRAWRVPSNRPLPHRHRRHGIAEARPPAVTVTRPPCPSRTGDGRHVR